MILKRLTDILKTFDKAELKRFERFVRSDYFNTNERVSRLLKVLKKFYPLFSSPNLTNEYLFRQIYGAGKFKDKTFRYLLSELLHLTQKFVAFAVIENDTTELKKNLVDGMLARKLFSIARSHLTELDKAVDRNFIIGSTYLHDKMEICLFWHMLFFFSNSQNPVMHKHIEGAEYQIYDTIMDLCHIYQNLDAIKRSHNLEYQDNILFAFMRNFDFKGMLSELENLESSFSGHKDATRLRGAFKIYICFMITFLDEKDEAYFQKMKDVVDKYEKFFKRAELRDIHVMLTNCCNIKRKTINDTKYLKLSFGIMKNALSKDLYFASKGQYMAFSTYFRILDTALALKEPEWAEDFINKYIKDIEPEIRDDVYNYSIAEIFFQKKQFEPVLESLAKIKFNYSLHKSNVRSLMLMAYYELCLFDQAFFLIDSYSHFLNKNKRITPQQREADSNFLSFARTLLKLKEKNENKTDLSIFKNEVLNCGVVSRKDWLLEKAEELGK